MDLTLSDFVVYLVITTFTGVTLISITSRTLHARREKQSLANRVVCRLCLHAFEDTSHVHTVDCPMCGALNEKGRSRRLG